MAQLGENPAGRSGTWLGVWHQDLSRWGPSVPVLGLLCLQRAAKPWGASPQKSGHKSERRRVFKEGGCCSQHDRACHAAPGPAAPERRAGHAANLGPGRVLSWGN